MKKFKKALYLLLSLSTMLTFTGCGGAKVETIEQKTDTQVMQEEKRVIALSVSLVDILSEINVELVGVPKSQYTLNEKAQEVETVGLPMSPDIEKVASLKPTHVISLTTLESMVKPKLEQVGIQGTFLNVENIDELKASIQILGEMFDRKQEAEVLITNFEAAIQSTIDSVVGKTTPKVLVLFGFPGNYLVASGSSFVGQMVEMLGAENVLKDESIAYGSANLEALLVEQPDVILRMTHGVAEEAIEMFNKEFKENPIWSQFEAVQEDKVYDLDDSLFNVSASLQTAEALEQLAQILYQ